MRPSYTPSGRDTNAVATAEQEQSLRSLRIKTGVQWRFVEGAFCTFTGGMRERDMLERKGLPVTVRQTQYGSVLAITPDQADAWLASRQTNRNR